MLHYLNISYTYSHSSCSHPIKPYLPVRQSHHISPLYLYAFVQAMLVFDPSHRITAQDARRHHYFNDLPDALRRVGNDMS